MKPVVSNLNAPTSTPEETLDLKKTCSAVVDAVETASTVVLVSGDCVIVVVQWCAGAGVCRQCEAVC